MNMSWNADELMATAEAATGLDDWGPEELRRPLEILCYALTHEARLHAAGAQMLRARLLGNLQNRLRLMDDRRRDPLLAQQVVSRPLIVLGLPRTGTSHLHSLLAADPGTRSPRVWEMSLPSPPPRRETYATDERIKLIGDAMQASGLLSGELMAIHPFSFDAPEECGQILEMSGYGAMYSAMCWVPTYSCWREHVDFRPAMRFHKQFLQNLQAYNPGKWWVLKSAEYHFHIEEILDVYPDACIVMTHRDPARTIPSEASLYRVMRRLTTDAAHYTPQAAGQAVLRADAMSAERFMNFRRWRGDERRILDVHYGDLLRDPIGIVANIYRHFGLELTEAARGAMRMHLETHRQNRHGVHRYALSDWGLTERDIEQNFSAYIDHYRIQREGRR